MRSPSGPRPSSPDQPLEAGQLLAERYRLLRLVSDGVGRTTVWQAADDVLARTVAIKILPGVGRAGAVAARPFLAAAGRAGSLSHPGLARVYDASVEDRPAGRGGRTVGLAYVVSEWVDGPTVSDLILADGPLEPADAVRLAHDAAGALEAAHAMGVGHGRVHPGNLMVTPSGRLRVTDAAVAAALHGDPLPPVPAGQQLAGPEVARDTRDLAAVLYAMLTGRWPAGTTPQWAAGLPAAPTPSDGALYAPRQVRAGVPRALDAVVVRALDPARGFGRQPLTTPRALAQALDEAGPELPAAAPAAPPRRWRPGRLLRASPKVLAVAVIAAVGLASYGLGQKVGELPRKPGALDALAEPTASPTAAGAAARRVDLARPPVVVRDYDPFGDGTEQPGTVANAYDGDPSTAWTTDGYSSASFGGLKSGVGLLVDLGAPVSIGAVQVGLVLPGAAIELRSTNTLGDNADGFTTLARLTRAPQVATLTPASAAPARYWLVWFTALPQAKDGRYRDGVAELVFLRAAS